MRRRSILLALSSLAWLSYSRRRYFSRLRRAHNRTQYAEIGPMFGMPLVPPTQRYWCDKPSGSAHMHSGMNGVSTDEPLPASVLESFGRTELPPWPHSWLVSKYLSVPVLAPGAKSDTPCPCLHDPGYHSRSTLAGRARVGQY